MLVSVNILPMVVLRHHPPSLWCSTTILCQSFFTLTLEMSHFFSFKMRNLDVLSSKKVTEAASPGLWVLWQPGESLLLSEVVFNY